MPEIQAKTLPQLGSNSVAFQEPCRFPMLPTVCLELISHGKLRLIETLKESKGYDVLVFVEAA